MKQVRIGVAGCGSVAQRGLLPHLSQDDIKDRVELTAVMDVVPGRAEATAARFGARLWFEDYEAMLASGIDAVVIASPIGVHYGQAMKAIAAGKHLHLNKTMTTTKAEADELIAAAGKAGVKVVASPGQMLSPVNQRIRGLLEEGAIGKVYWAESGMSWIGHEYEGFRGANDVLSNVDPTWYYKRGGGPMYDMAVYCLHTVTGILGPAQRVTGVSGIGLKERSFKGERITVEMDDNTHLLLDFGDATFAFIYGTNGSDEGRGTGLRLHGSAGVIQTSYTGFELLGDPALFGLSGGRLTAPVVYADLPYVSGPHRQIEELHVYADIMHLVDCILNDKTPIVTAEHARHVIEIIEKGYLAAQTGQTQALETTF
jgi:predicted dehydrogenase